MTDWFDKLGRRKHGLLDRPLTAETAPETVAAELEKCLLTTSGRAPEHASGHDWFLAATAMVRQALAPQWADTHRRNGRGEQKRVCYLSMEFLLGRLLTDALRNLGLYENCQAALGRFGFDIETIAEQEQDPGLGNGGLGRLAACLLDSMATLGIPAYGYGLRFEYGLFRQEFEEGWQVEHPDTWLHQGSPWEYPRPDISYRVPVFGRTDAARDGDGARVPWTETEDLIAMAHDLPICGYGSDTLNTLRLWAPRAPQEFDTGSFNAGDHSGAVEARTQAEHLTRVLYPDDTSEAGRLLRFRQEYFLVSASVQDILEQHRRAHVGFLNLPEKVAIAINDTHPAMVVPEMMRLLVDRYGVEWNMAFDLTRRTVSYTNHTLMPEALETWPVALFEHVLPRHLEIIYRINAEFLGQTRRVGGSGDLIRRLSLVHEEGERRIRMANLAFVGSHKVNGVSKVHTDLMKRTVFADLHKTFPDRIVNVTNGVTPRRWLAGANPELSRLISSRIGDGWLARLERLEELVPFADDPTFRQEFRAIKRANKSRLAAHIERRCSLRLDVDSMFDVHVKRIHEYKRQLLKLLHALALYNRLRDGRDHGVCRTVLFAGKAAPGYAMAKLIVKLIHDAAAVIDADPVTDGRLKLVFLPNYGVSEAQLIIPAADLSEQISTAGTEASGTGNMKLSLNGALTVGTLDGANIEIEEAVGPENFFAFGMTVEQVQAQRAAGYSPRAFYDTDAELREVLDMIADGYFSPDDPGRFRPIVDSLLGSDHYMVLGDFRSYMACQQDIEAAFRDPDSWSRRAILNVARLGHLSSDRAVVDYARDIWNIRGFAREPASKLAS